MGKNLIAFLIKDTGKLAFKRVKITNPSFHFIFVISSSKIGNRVYITYSCTDELFARPAHPSASPRKCCNTHAPMFTSP